MNKIFKQEQIGFIDFILNYKGSVEDYLINFMVEQNYNNIGDYYNGEKIIKTNYNKNEITNIPIEKNDVIANSKPNDSNVVLIGSYNDSFNNSFEL